MHSFGYGLRETLDKALLNQHRVFNETVGPVVERLASVLYVMGSIPSLQKYF